MSIFVFGLLTDADVAWMAQAGVQRPIKDREILIHEGRPLESVIFLLQGECVVTEHAAGEIARRVGEIVGEMSFFDSAPPSATVTAVGDGRALFLDKETVARRLEADVAFGCRFYRALAIFLADRMRRTVRRTGGGAPDLDPQPVAKDELNSRILDVVSMARDRFDRLLKMLVGER